MGKYIVQPDRYSCGPAAIYNSLKWAGVKINLKLFHVLQHSCRTIDPEAPHSFEANGTFDSDFDRVLRWSLKGKAEVKRKERPTFKQLKGHLDSGGSVCLGYFWEHKNKTLGHFIFIEGIKIGCFVIINDYEYTTSKKILLRRPSMIKKWLRKKGKDIPIAWLLTKTPAINK